MCSALRRCVASVRIYSWKCKCWLGTLKDMRTSSIRPYARFVSHKPEKFAESESVPSSDILQKNCSHNSVRLLNGIYKSDVRQMETLHEYHFHSLTCKRNCPCLQTDNACHLDSQLETKFSFNYDLKHEFR